MSGQAAVKVRLNTSNTRRIAFVEVSHEQADSLLSKGRITIGWSRCRVTELLTPVRCYKCQKYGHISKNCTEKDMADMCLNCCREGHKAKECENPKKCYQCGTDGHAIGTMHCPVYRDLIKHMRRSQQEMETQKQSVE